MNPVDPARDRRGRAAPAGRARGRPATVESIVGAGRALLRQGRAVTLRAVATELGCTAPALYRYIDGAAALGELLSEDVFVEVVGELTAAGEPYGEDDPAARLVAAATAFRGWALDNRAEFRLVFGAARGGGSGAEPFAGPLGGVLTRLVRQWPPPGPEGAEPDGALAAWAQLYGIVALEVFGHVRPRLIRSGALFRAVMREVGARAGAAGDGDRLAEVSREVLARRALTGRAVPAPGG
ncbi:TetR-like C-terminal domain-containing protein [Kitasatospora sp. NPDC097643]|uniref:TetR/AcrR family transcriptional regulator n=1 Tax=Kitasatospora sp. NPDC097643 TaxID=3157230 RepID=UPI00331E75DE